MFGFWFGKSFVLISGDFNNLVLLCQDKRIRSQYSCISRSYFPRLLAKKESFIRLFTMTLKVFAIWHRSLPILLIMTIFLRHLTILFRVLHPCHLPQCASCQRCHFQLLYLMKDYFFFKAQLILSLSQEAFTHFSKLKQSRLFSYLLPQIFVGKR